MVLNDDRIASLDALGFDWTAREHVVKKSFEERMDDLRAYKEKHGHINVKKKEDKSLYQFCSRSKYARNNPEKSSKLISDDRIASLDALGFDWGSNRTFAQRIEDLKAYKEKLGISM